MRLLDRLQQIDTQKLGGVARGFGGFDCAVGGLMNDCSRLVMF
jgi:hypothetical protein